MIDPLKLPPRQRAFYELWAEKRGMRRFPARAEFSMAELRPWLESLHLMEVLPDGDYLFKVFATKSAMRLGEEWTGRRLSELPQTWIIQDALVDYHRVARTGEPVFADRTRRHQDGRLYSWRRLILPLGSDQARVDHFFISLDYDFI